MHLFCIPFAGGNAWAYRALERFVSPEITVDGLELPGRGRRSDEPLRGSLDELANDVFNQIRARAVTGRYAIFGHSMGALLAYLAAHRIRRAGLPPPEALFLSGSSAPASRPVRQRHLLPSPEFAAMLRELGGCPPQVLEDAGLFEFFEPILRADFKAVEAWQRPEAPPLDLSQLELALNPGTGGAGGFGGDFAVNLGAAIKQASDSAEEADGLFSVGDLDQKPRVIAQSSPVVPAALKKVQADTVTVQVIFVVNQQGRVEEPKVRRSNNSAFDQVAINCVKSWKFEPGKRNGEPVRFRMMAPITFPKKK